MANTVQELVQQVEDVKKELQDKYATEVAHLVNARAEYNAAQNSIADGLPRRSIEYVEVKDQKAGYFIFAMVALFSYLVWKGKIKL